MRSTLSWVSASRQPGHRDESQAQYMRSSKAHKHTIRLGSRAAFLTGQRGGGGSEHESSRRMKTEMLIQLDGLSKGKQLVFLLASDRLALIAVVSATHCSPTWICDLPSAVCLLSILLSI